MTFYKKYGIIYIEKNKIGGIKIHKVICPYCKLTFDRDKEKFYQVSARRYAHLKCYEINEKNEIALKKEKQLLEEYIKKIFNIDTITAKINKQIATYIKENNYTYSGIRKALIYFYEIKKGDISKANQGLGIVPYIYDEAYRYYYSIWEANQKNKESIVKIETLYPNTKTVVIKMPKRPIKKNNLFSFLDEEE